MRFKDTLIKFFSFSGYEGDALKDYLEDMALKGWKLKNFNSIVLIFVKIEPQKLIYSVVMTSQRYIGAGADWESINETDSIAIYVTSNVNAEPIETDQNQKYEAIIKKMNQNTILGTLFTVLFVAPIAFYIIDFESTITSNACVFSSMFLLCVFLYLLLNYLHYIFWSIHVKKRLKKGLSLDFQTKKHIIKKMKYTSVLCVFMVAVFIHYCITSLLYLNYLSIIYVGTILIPLLIRVLYYAFSGFKKIRNKQKAIIRNIILGSSILIAIILITIAAKKTFFSNDKVPTLSYQDFEVSIGSNKSADYVTKTQSILASSEDCSMHSEQFNIRYKLIKSNIPFILEKCANSELHPRPMSIGTMFDSSGAMSQLVLSQDFWKVSDPAWGAKQVYENDYDHTIVIYQNCVLIIDNVHDPLTDSIKKNISKKLNK